MYNLYRNIEPPQDDLLKFNRENLKVRITKPAVFHNFHTFLWSIFSLCGSYVEYQLLKDGKIVSTSEVITKIIIFPFMSSKGLHIGPCQTAIEERGKGYYPYLLSKIIEDNPNKEYFMIVEQSNIASIKGVEKVGFRKIGEVEKRHSLYVKIRK